MVIYRKLLSAHVLRGTHSVAEDTEVYIGHQIAGARQGMHYLAPKIEDEEGS